MTTLILPTDLQFEEGSAETARLGPTWHQEVKAGAVVVCRLAQCLLSGAAGGPGHLSVSVWSL